MSKRITNTSKKETGVEWLMGGNPEAIYAQEARGQKELLQSESLPTEGSKGLEKLGFELGEPFEDDPIFRPATFPEGWKKETTGHSMWSKVLDDKGRERFSIFYKAAFYDRSAKMHAERRFRIEYVDEEDYENPSRHVRDNSTGDIVFASVISSGDEELRFEDGDKNYKECEKWLDETYPDWRDPFVYWL